MLTIYACAQCSALEPFEPEQSESQAQLEIDFPGWEVAECEIVCPARYQKALWTMGKSEDETLPDYLTVNGLRCQIISMEEAERADYIVCMPWQGDHYFPDNMQAACCRCLVTLQVRPTAPTKPKRICLPCVMTSVH